MTEFWESIIWTLMIITVIAIAEWDRQCDFGKWKIFKDDLGIYKKRICEKCGKTEFKYE